MEFFVSDRQKEDPQGEDWVNAKAQTVAAVDDLGPFIREKRARTQFGETADGERGRGRAGESAVALSLLAYLVFSIIRSARVDLRSVQHKTKSKFVKLDRDEGPGVSRGV